MGLEIKNIKLGVEPYWSWKRDSIMINRGQVIHLTGKNGEGKSSILRLMMGLMPYEGEVLWCGSALDVARDIYYFSRYVMMMSNMKLIDALSLILHGYLGQRAIEKQLISCMEKWGLQREINQNINQLSEGQKARCGLSILEVIERQVWLLDEPFAHLDVQMSRNLLDKIKVHTEKGGVVLVVSHQNQCLDDDGLLVKKWPICRAEQKAWSHKSKRQAAYFSRVR